MVTKSTQSPATLEPPGLIVGWDEWELLGNWESGTNVVLEARQSSVVAEPGKQLEFALASQPPMRSWHTVASTATP
jgi:hypothetical protein